MFMCACVDLCVCGSVCVVVCVCGWVNGCAGALHEFNGYNS